MNLFFHHVGTEGAQRDFPKTVFAEIPISVIENNIPAEVEERDDILRVLRLKFPSGRFNCWGVPSGASSVVNRLAVGDAVLLFDSVRIDGMAPALAEVAAYWPIQLPTLSNALWGQEKYPYIFYFSTERLRMLWAQFREEVDFAPNYDPRGKMYQVKQERLDPFGGVKAYVQHVRTTYGEGTFHRRSEVVEAQEVIDTLAGKPSRGQGHADVKSRLAIEHHAMRRAQTYFENQGWSVDPTPARTQCYDLECLHSATGKRLRVEVKGTTSAGQSILLTRNEVEHAREQYPHVALYILANVILGRDGERVEASGGSELVYLPWDVRQGELNPLVFEHVVPPIAAAHRLARPRPRRTPPLTTR